MALDLVRQGVDVILATGGDNSIKAAIAATNTIPICLYDGQRSSSGRLREESQPARR